MPDVRTWSLPSRDRTPPLDLRIQDWVTPRRGDLLEAMEDSPFLQRGGLYLCTDVRQSAGGPGGSMIWRVEYGSPKSPSGKIFGPPVGRFRVALRHVELPSG